MLEQRYMQKVACEELARRGFSKQADWPELREAIIAIAKRLANEMRTEDVTD